MDGLELRTMDWDDPAVAVVHERYLADIHERYGGAPGCVEASGFASGRGCFLVAWLDDEPVAMGGLRRHADGIGELKRMYVEPTARGRGVARAILGHLEQVAREHGHREIWLETGTEQPEAIALYESTGYERIEPYGEFAEDPRSRCYAKVLRPDVA
jgi:GNAT superfamily N-acetyltransferase